jgi:Rad4 beta-hairpin domain 3/Rad4 beta-hairpin domain 1/Rad4 beta-hairpin domain 2
MSFHFNLSSSEDEDDFQTKYADNEANDMEDGVDDKKDPKVADLKRVNNLSDADEESDEVDWEDAVTHDNEDDDDLDQKPPAISPDGNGSSSKLNAVTIDFNKRKTRGKVETKIKRKPRNVVRVESLDLPMQQFLWNLHNAHLLAMSSHAVFLSQVCSDPEVMAIAYSLIPESFHSHPPTSGRSRNGKANANPLLGPSLSQMQELVEWYFDFVRGTLPQKPPVQRKKRPKARVEVEHTSDDGNDSESEYGARTKKRPASVITPSPHHDNRGSSGRDARRKRREKIKNELEGGSPTSESAEFQEKGENRRSTKMRNGISKGSVVESKHSKNEPKLHKLKRKKSKRKVESTVTDNLDTNQVPTIDIEDTEKSQESNRAKRATTKREAPTCDPSWKSVDLGKAALLTFVSSLSMTNRQDPYRSIFSDDDMDSERKSQFFVGLLIAMLRSLGWRARLIVAVEPRLPDVTADHPLFILFFSAIIASVKGKNTACACRASSSSKILYWVEIFCSDPESNSGHRWVHVDPLHQLADQPDQVEYLIAGRSPNVEMKLTTKRGVVAYALGVEHCTVETNEMDEDLTRLRLTDVTPRYAFSWVSSLRKRRIVRTKNCSIEDNVKQSWWSKTLHLINAQYRSSRSASKDSEHAASKGTKDDPIHLDKKTKKKRKPRIVPVEPSHFDKFDELEAGELVELAKDEALPTSKGAYRTHPTYVIPSELGKAEVLAPDAFKRACGSFKGQVVYRRSDVSTAFTATKWLYDGRKVRDDELSKPVKVRQKRKKPIRKGFRALETYGVGDTNDGNEERQILLGSKPLEDETENLYGKWQTDEWSPEYIGPDDEIPMNDYKNVELAFLNPGLVHIDERGLAVVAKKLKVPYAPCVIGFEGHGPYRAPTIRGIVVHQHNEQMVREAGIERRRHERERAEAERRRSILLLWKRVMVGLLTKERLDREYGTDSK